MTAKHLRPKYKGRSRPYLEEIDRDRRDFITRMSESNVELQSEILREKELRATLQAQNDILVAHCNELGLQLSRYAS